MLTDNNKKQIRVLLGASRGSINLGRLENLKSNTQYNFYIVGMDASENQYKLPLLDEQIKVPTATDPNFINALIDIVRNRKIDVVVPNSDFEVEVVSKNKDRINDAGAASLCSSYEITHSALDKAKMLQFLKDKGFPTPKFQVPSSIEELINAVKLLGYPRKTVIFKPAFAGGGNRGVWLVKEDFSKDLLNAKGIPFITLDSLVEQIKKTSHFPETVVMEYLSGEEYSVDGLAENGESVYILPRVRVAPLPGHSQEALFKKNPEVEAYVKEIARLFKFDSIFNVQLKYSDEGLPRVYEINPRISATVAANTGAGVDLLFFTILKSLGLPYPKDLQPKSVRMIRFWKEFYTE
ncbi:MAG: ATP-grasp domain-containing protein [bacterium]|nr:ATP-grasp domain-containing protein [bacterium]